MGGEHGLGGGWAAFVRVVRGADPERGLIVPSYRAEVDVLELRPGHAPEEVLDSAVAAVAGEHVVEARDLDIVRGVPRISVRFLVEASSDAGEDADAHLALTRMTNAVERVAVWQRPLVRRRVGGRWVAVAGHAPPVRRSSSLLSERGDRRGNSTVGPRRYR